MINCVLKGCLVYNCLISKCTIWCSFYTELDERMRDLKNELQSFDGEEYDEDHKRKAIDALKRMENWNLFSDTYEVRPDFYRFCYF